jgi:hypothetical protein
MPPKTLDTIPKSEPTPAKRTRRTRSAKSAKEVFMAATPEAAAFLVAVMHDEKATFSVRMDAAKTILDRVYGRATQLCDEHAEKLEIVVEDAVRVLLE